MLVVALETIVEAARRVVGEVLAVDAIDEEADPFYERHDNVATPRIAHRLVRKLSTIARAVDRPWP